MERPPLLRPPVSQRWRADAGDGIVTRTPVTDGRVVVVAAGPEVIGYAVSDGAVLWRRSVAPSAAEIQAVDDGVVIAAGEIENTTLTAFSWDGDPLWTCRCGLSSGADRLRGAGSKVLVVGVGPEPDDRSECQLRSAASANLENHFRDISDLPHLTPLGLVWSAGSDDPGDAGLFLTDATSGATTRLVDLPHTVRAIEGDIAVIDTFGAQARMSRLMAVGLGNHTVRWQAGGGGTLHLAIGGGQLACAEALDETRLAVTLRDLASGDVLWRATPVAGEATALLMSADCVVSSLDGVRTDLYDRGTGELVQSLEERSSLTLGGCLSPAGLVDVSVADVRCLTGVTG